MEQQSKKVVDLHNKLKATREPLERLYWSDAYQYTRPHRGMGFIQGSDNCHSANSAKSYQSKIYDSTAVDSVRLLASSMISGLTPSNSQWFSLQVPNAPAESISKASRQWLDSTSKTLYQYIHSSDYNKAVFDFFEDICIAGIGGLYVEMRYDDSGKPAGLHFECWTPDTMYVAETQGKGFIDTVTRELHYSAAEAVHKFGIKNVPNKIAQKFNSEPASQDKFTIIHCIRPRFSNRNKAGANSTSKLFESCYVCSDTGKVLKESGYDEFPVIIPRWSLLPHSDYAVGPVHDCLADIKTLNKTVEMMLTNAEMSIAGTYIAQNDGVLNPKTTRIRPRQLVFAADVNNLKPLATGGDFRISYQEVARLQDNIRRIMMSDDLSPIGKANPTATEVNTRSQIIRQILGPVYARLQSEFLEPLINRCLMLVMREGNLLPPAPEELIQMDIIPQYQSPMARAQRHEEVVAMNRYEEDLAGISQLYPQALDLYDVDKAMEMKAELMGVPASVIRDSAQVKFRRDEQAKQVQAAQAQQQLQAQ